MTKNETQFFEIFFRNWIVHIIHVRLSSAVKCWSTCIFFHYHALLITNGTLLIAALNLIIMSINHKIYAQLITKSNRLKYSFTELPNPIIYGETKIRSFWWFHFIPNFFWGIFGHTCNWYTRWTHGTLYKWFNFFLHHSFYFN